MWEMSKFLKVNAGFGRLTAGREQVICRRFTVIQPDRSNLEEALRNSQEAIAENGRFDAGGWGDYANAVAGKIGAVLFAGCVAGVEGEGKDVETECCAKSLNANNRRRAGWWRRGI